MLGAATLRRRSDEEDAMGVCGTRICRKRGTVRDSDVVIEARGRWMLIVYDSDND